MKNPVIYKITSPSGEIYIGQSWGWIKRKSVYKRLSYKEQVKIYNSLKKYGYDNHIIEIIETLNLNISQKDLNSREVYWWKYYKDLGIKMLNIRYPGSNGKISEESIKKAIQTRKLNVYIPSKETIKKIVKTIKINGYVHSKETKQKIGSKHKGKEISLEAERLNNFKKGELVYRLNRTKENITNFKYFKNVLY